MSQLLELWERSWDFEKSGIDKNTFSTGMIFLEFAPFQNIIYEKFDDKFILMNSNEKEIMVDTTKEFLFLCANIDAQSKLSGYESKAAIIHNKNSENGQWELLYFPVDAETIKNSLDINADVSYISVIDKFRP